MIQVKSTTGRWIVHSRPTLGEAEAAAAAAVIRSGMVAQGEQVERLEQGLAGRCGVSGAAAVSSGTAALYLALAALGAKTGREVILPSYVCSAVRNAVHLTGARCVLADVDPKTGNIDPGSVLAAISAKTAAIVVVHLFGRPAPVEEIAAFGIPVVEDCAQAIGASIGGRPVGSFGNAAIFSFYATKVVTTGEGGAVASNDAELIHRIRRIRDYDHREDDRWGFNFKLSDIQAAVGNCQLERLDGLIARRRELARAYDRALDPKAWGRQKAVDGEICFRYVLAVQGNVATMVAMLHRHGVGAARPVFRPLHRILGRQGFPGSEEAWCRHLSLPIYPLLEDSQQQRVIEAVTALQDQRGHAAP